MNLIRGRLENLPHRGVGFSTCPYTASLCWPAPQRGASQRELLLTSNGSSCTTPLGSKSIVRLPGVSLRSTPG